MLSDEGAPTRVRCVPILIIDAPVAGLHTAKALRMKEYVGPIALVGEEAHRTCDEPPLSKEMALPAT